MAEPEPARPLPVGNPSDDAQGDQSSQAPGSGVLPDPKPLRKGPRFDRRNEHAVVIDGRCQSNFLEDRPRENSDSPARGRGTGVYRDGQGVGSARAIDDHLLQVYGNVGKSTAP
jgi:hypothetical protein